MTRLPPVSDHAVLRYLQRAHGLDVEALRRSLADAAQRGVDLGACGVIRGGIKLVIRDGAVVTIVRRRKATKPKRSKETMDGTAIGATDPERSALGGRRS